MSKSMPSTYPIAPSSGNTPAMTSPPRSHSEVYFVGGAVLALAIGIGIFWMTTQSEEFRSGSPTQGVRAIPTPPPVAAPLATTVEPLKASPPAPALPTQLKDTRHADVYFDSGRTGLSDEAKVYLTAHAEFLKQEPDWGVIIQGSTDARGSAGYNKRLGAQRAEAVRAFLAGLGIPDTSMKVVSLGKEGALCQDTSAECQQLGRRVHLEFLKIGADHLAPAAPTLLPAAGEAVLDSLAVDTAGTSTTGESASPEHDASSPQPSAPAERGTDEPAQ